MDEQPDWHQRLATIANALRSGDKPPVVTVRSFLQWFGAQRRGYWIVKEIREALVEAGLRTEPDFEPSYIDSEISFVLAPAIEDGGIHRQEITVKLSNTVTLSDQLQTVAVDAAFGDPTHRMSKLAAANRIPTSVSPDATLSEAVTIMMANDFSQLPVAPNERDVKGVVSWQSIGMRLALRQTPATAKDAMDPHAEIGADANLFAAIPLIVEHGYVLVRGADQRIVGIVTTSDLSRQFQQLAEPFLLSGEIENHMRRIIGSHFDPVELQAVRDPSDDSRKVETAADLTFGEYGRLLEEPKRWARLDLEVDRAVFIKLLDKVREIRNDVMHFDPDSIPDGDLEALRDFARFLRTLQTIGAT